jgi:hypothetical protein
MKWELWHREGEGYSFFQADNAEARRFVPADAKLVTTFDAMSWDDAHRQRNEYLGWEPYKPMQ